MLLRSICLAEPMSLPMIQMSAMKKLDFWLVQRLLPLHFDIFRLTKTRFQLVTPTVLELLKPGPQCLAYAGGGADFRDFQLHIPSGNQRWQWEITEIIMPLNGRLNVTIPSMGQSLPWQSLQHTALQISGASTP